MATKQLDPKLRRLMQAKPERLRGDVTRGFVEATADADADAPAAEELCKKVIVQLGSGGVPGGFSDLSWIPLVDNFFTVSVPVSRLGELAAHPNVAYVEAGRNFGPMLETSVAETRADRVRRPPLELDGEGVLVGIIDFGIDFTLDDFRNDDGSTRIAFLWDQFLTPQGTESSPAGFGFGVEYDRQAIDQALGEDDPFSVVRHNPGARSHGTHVAGTAAGNGRSADGQFPADRFVGCAPGSTLVFVQPSSSDSQTTFSDSVNVAEAAAYIFQKADELNLPCVINMSLGQNGGSHDGESVVERAIDRLLGRRGRAMVLAAGNEHVWRGHASGELAEGDTRVLSWRAGGGLQLPDGTTLPPGFGDFSPNEVEIWTSSRDVFHLRLGHPNGDEQTAVVRPGETLTHTFSTGEEVFIDSERFTVLNGDARIYIEVGPDPDSGRITTGVWEIEIEAVTAPVGRFDAWIERDARRQSNNFADQSFFVGNDFDGVATLGTPATTRRGIAVANYDHVALAPNTSSSRGRTRDGRDKPEIAAPGTNIFASCSLGGRQDGGSTLPMRTRKSGTSMAAPHVTGVIALMLQRNPRLTSEQIRKILIASANPPPGVVPFDNAWGYGRLDAEAAVDLVG